MTGPDSETVHETDRSDGCNCGFDYGGSRASSDRWISGSPVLDVELPGNIQTALGRLLGDSAVETLGDWIAEVRSRTGGGQIKLGDLCHSGTATPHWGEMAGERYHFRCFYDAVVLAALADQPVDIRTESPDGVVITARAAGSEELTVTPDDAVLSFGVDDRVTQQLDADLSAETVYSAVCPFVRAFPHPNAYYRWAESVPAVTITMPLSGATELASALVE